MELALFRQSCCLPLPYFFPSAGCSPFPSHPAIQSIEIFFVSFRFLFFCFILQEKLVAERENALLKEQELYNRLRNKDYGPAIALALELKRPQKLWGVLRDAMTEGMGESASGAVDEG